MSNEDSDAVPTIYQGAHLINLLKEKRMTKQRLDDLVKSGLLSDLFEADVSHVDRTRFWEALDGEYSLLVNETVTLWSLIERSNYNWVNPSITEVSLALQFSYASARMYSQKVRFLRHGTPTDSSAMLDVIASRVYRACGVRELLTFGRENPGALWEAPVVALGESVQFDGKVSFMGICGPPDERRLRLYPAGTEFPLRTRFLSARILR